MACDNLANPEPAQYTISFSSHGGSAVEAVTAVEGTQVSKPTDPTREGFAFAGWFNAETGGTAYAWPHALNANVTMHAQWTAAQTYTIAFDTHGGTAVTAITQNEGTQVSRPADPAKDGFILTGWFDAETGGTAYAWPHALNADLTMHAQWTAAYTLTFDSHDGTAVAAITQAADTPVSRPADPTKDGFVLSGWYSAETGGTAYAWPHTLSANVTMHAQWTPVYTVTFHPNGGGPAPEPQSVAAGERADEPALMTKASVPPSAEGLYLDGEPVFDGWYDAAYATKYTFADPVAGDLDLYAKWTGSSAVDLSGETGAHFLEKALNYLARQTLAQTTSYTILLAGNYSLAGISSDSDPNIKTTNAVITLAGIVPVEINLSSNGYLFLITAGKLVLDNNITLKGSSSNNKSLVYVYGSSTSLTMKAGAKITGNKSTWGGGVYVQDGSFAMEGGEISSNFATYGCGLYVTGSDSSFTMKAGAKIAKNTSTTPGTGGGVYVRNGASFTMEGGEITGNAAYNGSGGGVNFNSSGSFVMKTGLISGNYANSGGGASVSGSSSFIMEDGEISDNSGGGVFFSSSSSFVMKGGIITGNSSSSSFGGGVYTVTGSFIMKAGAKITKNTASSGGGGVYIPTGSFIMEGGEISGNSSSSNGGGVYVTGRVSGNTSFTMKAGAKITGNTATTGGGGVYVTGNGGNSSFIMEGGEISGNSSSNNNGGGGVYVTGNGSSFTQKGGEISGNSASSGGGVHVSYSNFTMEGGEISGNSTFNNGDGGGVCLIYNSVFTMEGGEISGNSANYNGEGGGVYVFDSSNFTLENGTISGNYASSGGGVYVYYSGSFNKTGGIIYGDTDGTHTEGSTENTAKDGDTYGHTVYYYKSSSNIYYRDTTLTASDNISTADTLPANSGDSLNNWTKK